jgi:hypothetical protein
MLTTRNSGKYLTKRWNEMRIAALADRYQFTEAELTWLEIGPDEGIVSWMNPETFLVETQPIDGPDIMGNVPQLTDMRKLTKRE